MFNEPKKIRIAIVDDHSLYLESLNGILAREENLSVEGCFINGKEALRQASRERYDLMIIDYQLPDMNGVELAKRLQVTTAKTVLLMISMHSELYLVERALEAGIAGFMTKCSTVEDLLYGIKCLSQGKPYFCERILKKLTKKGSGPNGSTLTSREKDILKHIAMEYTNAEAAELLHISVSTVDFHRKNIHQKLNIRNTAGLTKYAIRTGLINLD